MTAPSQASAHAAENEAAGQESGSCQFCERKGLPILPVRYAVCQRNDRNGDIPELETSRIQEFTDILLDKSLVGGEEQARSVPDEVRAELTQSTGNQVNKYILRQLRQGYLYFYDQDNTDGNYWYAYAITSDGKYYQFPVLQPPALDDIKFPDSCKNKPGDVLDASIVTLPFPEKSGTLYYAFSEHPWPNAHIRMIGSDEAWRQDHMQQVNIPAWVGGQRQSCAFGIDELEKVAEYSAAAESLDEQFWSSGPTRPLYEPDELRNAMQRRLDHAGSEYQGKGLILAVKDEIGIIDELNAYRHQALASVEAFFYNKEEEDDEAQIHNVRRRKLLCMQAIDAFQKRFEQGYRAQQQADADKAVEDAKKARDEFVEKNREILDQGPSPAHTFEFAERSRLNSAVEQAQRERDELFQVSDEDKAERKRLEDELNELNSSRVQGPGSQMRKTELRNRINRLKSDAELASEQHLDQLHRMYDVDALTAFKQAYEDNTAHCQSLAAVFDDDYAIWAKHGLPAVIGRYSQSDYWTGLGLSGLISNALRGGIMSPSSGGLWKLLADDLESSESPLLAALFANDKELIMQARERLGSLPAGTKLSAQTLKSWGERFQQARERTQKPDGRAPTSDQIINRWRPIQDLLATTIGNSIASLVLYRAAGVPAPDYKPALSQFVRYHQLAFMADPQALDGEQPAPTLVEREVKLSELYQWLRAVSQASAQKPNQGADTSEAMKSLDGMVGNFSAPMADSDRTVRIALPVYVDIKAVTGGSGEPPALPGSYTPEDEQQRLGDLAQNARDIGNTLLSAHKGSGQVAGACLVLWSLIVSWQEGAFVDDEEGADWSKIIGSGVSVASGAMAGIEGYHKIRMASLGLSTEGAVIGGIKWAFVSDVLGAAGGMISIWDGLKKLTEANEANKTGQSLTGHYGMIVGGVGVIAGIASIVVISASTGVGLVVGVFFGILTLLLGYAFVAMVSPAVQMWVNRSILGKPSEREDMQVLPFDDMASEQSSLEMVFQGVLVELSWSPVRPDTNQYVESPYDIDMDGLKAATEEALGKVEVNVKVAFPDVRGIVFDVALSNKMSGEVFFDWTYRLVGTDSATGGGLSQPSYSSGGTKPDLVESKGDLNFEWSDELSKALAGDRVTFEVSFYKAVGQSAMMRYSDAFVLEF
ncbi:T6SS effector BTH_I2691 family protein [Salinicola lusitanus]|uniref:T6SS effector BTH_I2691 family protein n=1 Tax=Salinicola lusitanus TaxID=1949085 RepID=A0ABZ3CRT9_9GAMM